MPSPLYTREIVKDVIEELGLLSPAGAGGGAAPGGLTGGKTFYVSSTTTGSSNANGGTDPDAPLATLDAAINKCTANQGDVIVLMPNHTEALTSTSVALDVAGITVIGQGRGSNRPTFTAAATSSVMPITAADVTLYNLQFTCNVASQTAMVTLSAAADGCRISGCEFLEGTNTGLNFITISGAADDVTIEWCNFYAPTAGNYDHAILVSAACARMKIRGNYIYGDFDVAGISNTTAAGSMWEVAGNKVANLLTTQHAIEITVATTGFISGNELVADTKTSVLDPGSMRAFGNIEVNGIDATATKTLLSNGGPLEWQVVKHASSAFTGGTPNDHGDHDGTGDPYTIFTVTGDVAMRGVVGIVNTTLVGAGTIEVGVAGNTAKIIAQVADATDLADGDVWTDAGSEAGVDILPAGGVFFINDGADIIETLGTANITAGQIDYYCIWAPLEAGASVVSA